MKDALAAAGNKSLLYQVIFSLRDEFGRDAVTAHINRGYELKLAAAERIAVLLDTPDLAERIALAGAKRRNEGKLATAAVVQEGPLV
ncbi:MAG: hypothetical protein H7332_18950, partial [Bdellovibrionales bacterium]|nr:hypothetical protein [Ramlibacter sp.]